MGFMLEMQTAKPVACSTAAMQCPMAICAAPRPASWSPQLERAGVAGLEGGLLSGCLHKKTTQG